MREKNFFPNQKYKKIVKKGRAPLLGPVVSLGQSPHSGAQSCYLASHLAPEQDSRLGQSCHSASHLTPEPSLVTWRVIPLRNETRGSASRVTRPVASLLSQSCHSTSHLTPEPSLVTRRAISLRSPVLSLGESSRSGTRLEARPVVSLGQSPHS